MKNSRYRVDLHTHSIISQDGGITAAQYEKLLQSEGLDCVAITDHNETSFARIMQKKFGDRIIIGEEIDTPEGEVIGLYLQETIPGGIGLDEAVASIKHQHGLVYLPHPYEKFRKGLKHISIDRIASDIDIVEVFNARGRFRGKPTLAQQFALKHAIAQAASSDAHGWKGVGSATSDLSDFPTNKTLKNLLTTAVLEKKYAPFYTFLYPTINRIKNSVVLSGED
jgi:predicted metal-dependent phosphoesterase TrpH